MAVIDVNIQTLKTKTLNDLNDVKNGLESARNSAGSLLIPSDFRFCNYLLTEFYSDITDYIDNYYKLKNWIDESVNTLENIGSEFGDVSSSLPNHSAKKSIVDIKI